jgi:hypothetical protein
MRRALSISLILFLWLGPFAAVLPGIDESRLPLCCRRHGAHHCADADNSAARSADSGPSFNASSRCPHFPATVAAATTAAFTPAVGPAGAAPVVDKYASGASRDAARMGQLRTQANRGPPSSFIA